MSDKNPIDLGKAKELLAAGVKFDAKKLKETAYHLSRFLFTGNEEIDHSDTENIPNAQLPRSPTDEQLLQSHPAKATGH